MAKLRLFIVLLMLVGSVSMFDAPVKACESGGGNCPPADRPNGCACCSDNHCASTKCDIVTQKCVPKDGPPMEDPPQN